MNTRKLLCAASVVLSLAGCGGGGTNGAATAGASPPVRSALTASIDAGATPVRLYLAYYGLAPANPTYSSYLSMMQASGPQAVALDLASRFGATANDQLAAQVLTNLGVSAASTNPDAYAALTQALAQIFAVYSGQLRGVVVMNLVNILKDLEGNATYGTAAQSFNSQTSAAYTYATNPANTQSPALSGVAAKGPLAGATVGVYDLNADGTKGTLLASGSTAADGRFTIPLASRPAGAVLLETTGGTYQSAYDGATLSSQGHISAIAGSVSSTGESGLSINPLSDMTTELARSYITVQQRSFSQSLDLAEKWVAWQYGLKTAPSRIVPKFDVTAAAADPQSVHLALVLAALDTLGKRLSPSNPDAIFASLSADFSDGVFDGWTVSQAVTLNGSALPATTGTTEFLKAFAVTYTGTAAGWRPAYLDAHFSRGTITENYQASLIPVYVAPEIASYYPATWSSPLPKTTSLDASAAGYSCGAGASISFDANGNATCGSYYFCYGGATLITSGTTRSCSDGSLVAYQSQTIATYTAPTPAPYTATTVDNYLAATTIGDPPTGTIPIFRATAVHVLTQAERDAMMANDAAAGDAAAAKVSALGVPTSLQMEWLSKIGNALVASVGH